MLTIPLEIPPSAPPPTAPASRPASEASGASHSFGEHLKQAQGPDQRPRRDEERRDPKPANPAETSRPASATDSGVRPTNAEAPGDSGTDTANLPADIRELVHHCLAGGCESEGTPEDAQPVDAAIGTDAASTAAVAGTVIAQAMPVVVVQVSTDTPSTEVPAEVPAEAGVTETEKKPKVSTMHRAALAKNSAPVQNATPPIAAPTDAAVTVDAAALTDGVEAPSAGTAEDANTAQTAKALKATTAAQVTRAPADGATESSPVVGLAGEAQDEAASARQAEKAATVEQAAVPSEATSSTTSEHESPDGSSHRQSPGNKHNPPATASTAPVLASVTVAALGAKPQQVSVTTVSAADHPTTKAEQGGADQIAGAARPSLDSAQSIDRPATETPHHAPVSESAEPVRQPRDTSAAQAADTAKANLNEAERVRFVQRVARAVHTAVDRGGEVRLRLNPPELGRLTLDVVVRDGVMNAHLEAETQSARSLLIDNLPALRDRLAEQNVRIDRFDVNLRGGTSGSLPDQTPGQSGRQLNQQPQASSQPATAAVAGIRPGATPIQQQIQTNDQLNVVV